MGGGNGGCRCGWMEGRLLLGYKPVAQDLGFHEDILGIFTKIMIQRILPSKQDSKFTLQHSLNLVILYLDIDAKNPDFEPFVKTNNPIQSHP